MVPTTHHSLKANWNRLWHFPAMGARARTQKLVAWAERNRLNVVTFASQFGFINSAHYHHNIIFLHAGWGMSILIAVGGTSSPSKFSIFGRGLPFLFPQPAVGARAVTVICCDDRSCDDRDRGPNENLSLV
jgi:hypothetical protein